MYKTFYDSPIGKLIILSDGKSITNLYMEKQKYINLEKIRESIEDNSLEVFIRVKECLDNYFNGKKVSFREIPLNLEVSDYRKKVYEILLNIPYGKMRTYGDIALEVASLNGKNKCSQAIGNAIGHNPISIIIPCHRVVGKSNIGGYAGGVSKKKKLLEIEGNVNYS